MAIPKVFISSTCYDLKQIRNDLKGFVESLGYEAILSEQNSIPYNVKETLEDDCYSEIIVSDVVVGIIGGKFGSESLDDSGQSISMREMQNALLHKKQMYILVDCNDIPNIIHMKRTKKTLLNGHTLTILRFLGSSVN